MTYVVAMDLVEARLRRPNAAPVRPGGDYVLYWMQLYRRLERNHALDRALALATELRRPLVVYEGLRLDYPWASRRLHRFVLEGMRANAAAAARLGLAYWPFVETPERPARGLLRRLAARACAVVTDDAPAFVVPEQTRALASRIDVAMLAVDGSSIVPLSLLGPPVSAAAHLRPRIHRLFADAWAQRAHAKPRVAAIARSTLAPPFDAWDPGEDLDALLARLPLDASVPPVAGRQGGAPSAKKRLARFLAHDLRGYAELRSRPAPAGERHATELSPWLHFGHLSIDALVEGALGSVDWTPERLDPAARGRRDGFYTGDADVDALLDECITWRDVGHHWMWHRRDDVRSLAAALPAWASDTLARHRDDRRAFVYSVEEWEAGETHDALWNAAQRELVATGSIHGYLRMLWGKKVIEWSESPEEAYRTLEHLNNRWALDGRDPNSYSGILWCFGLFDRPWAPERPVLGRLRYMSSENTARKFRLGAYLDWVSGLPTIAEVRGAGRRSDDASSHPFPAPPVRR